jgi:hypothetical protein
MNEPPLHVDLPSSAALARVRFVKRVTWKEMRECAAEAYEIRAAVGTPALDTWGIKEVHRYIENGDAKWAAMIEDYGLKPTTRG